MEIVLLDSFRGRHTGISGVRNRLVLTGKEMLVDFLLSIAEDN
jgi:hypothetical protein